MPITDEDREKLKSVFLKIHSEIQGDWLNKVPEANRKEALNTVTLENFHRVCMETLFDLCLPYDDTFVAEIATRQCAITITALPFDLRYKWVDEIVQKIPISVNRKVGNAHVIRTHWNINDGETTNN